jgi:hypothetical protein
MAVTSRNGVVVPGGPKGLAAWYHFTACYAVGCTDKKTIIEAGVAIGHNRGQLGAEWAQWFRTREIVHAPYVDRELETA